MEFTHQQEASSSSSSQPVHQSSFASASTSSEPRTLRSSARVKAAKEKGKDKERELGEQVPTASESPRTTRIIPTLLNKRARVSSTSKGKGKDSSEDTPVRPSKKFVFLDVVNSVAYLLMTCSELAGLRILLHQRASVSKNPRKI